MVPVPSTDNDPCLQVGPRASSVEGLMVCARMGPAGEGRGRLRGVGSGPSRLITKELSPETWTDFEKLFAKYGGVQGGCWCVFYQRPRPPSRPGLTRAEGGEANRRDKEALVRQGRSHGILVYAGAVPIGWCQYGPREELPRIDAGRKYRKLALGNQRGRLWRITCFFVDNEFRRKGVARVALRAALATIRREGGGTVEAYPATHGRAVGIWFGTVAMFEAEGFRKVAAYGRSNILVRRTLRGRRRSRPPLDLPLFDRPRTPPRANRRARAPQCTP